MPILLADGAPNSYRLGDQVLDAVHLGDDKMWPLLAAQGMSKSGTQDAGTGSFVKVTGWTADAGSTVTNNALVVAGAGACTISTAVAWAGTGGSRSCRVLRNGTVVWTSTAVSGTPSGSFPLTVAAGDVLTLEAQTSSYVTRTIAAAGTFLRLVPA